MGAMNDDEKRAALARVDFFTGCSDRELTDIAKLTEPRDFAIGDELCHEDDFGRIAFVVLEGEADVTKDGKHVGVATAGDVVGELAMLGDGHRTATLTARTPMSVLMIEPEEIDSVLAADPSAAKRLGRHDAGEESR